MGMANSCHCDFSRRQKKSVDQELFPGRCIPWNHTAAWMEMVATGIAHGRVTDRVPGGCKEHIHRAKEIMMDKMITFRNANLHYEIHGSGKPVMLIHGFAEDTTVWEQQVPSLQNDFRLIIPDIPGSGKSIMNNYGALVEDHAECIKAILDAENINSATIIGHSMGGYIALAFAEKYPLRLNALGLFHSTAYPDNEEKKDLRRKSISFIRQNGSAPFIEQSVPNLFSEHTKKQKPHLITELVERYSQFDPKALISYYEAMIERPDRVHVLKNLPAPVMFIIGEEDKAVPLQQSLQQCHIPSLSFIHISPETAHMGMLEDPVSCNNFLIQFLNNIYQA